VSPGSSRRGAGASSGRSTFGLDVLAIARGGGLALGVCLVAAVTAHLLDVVGEGGSPLALPLLLVAVGGLVAGGWVAARACARNPLTHAALASVAAIAILLAANVARQLLDGDDIRWSYTVLWLPLALAAGLAGGLTALRPPRHRADSPGDLSRG
jgi:uncharacterized membrane protein YfcA